MLGSTTSGMWTVGLWARPHSRASSMAINRLSVPPVVMLPAVAPSPPTSPATMATTSVSNLRRLGKAVGFSPFSEKKVV